MKTPIEFDRFFSIKLTNGEEEDWEKLYSGRFSTRACEFRFFPSEGESLSFIQCFSRPGVTLYLPSIFPLNSEHPQLPSKFGVFFYVTGEPIWKFFSRKIEAFSKQSDTLVWFPYIESCFREIFGAASRGMIHLLKHKLGVKSLREMSRVSVNELGEYNVQFMNVQPCGDNIEVVHSSIRELRDVMKDVLGMSGLPYDHRCNGVVQDILNYLTNITDDYIKFQDPSFLLHDPWIYDYREIYERSTNYHIFIKDNPQGVGMEPYYDGYPKTWKNWIDPNSFIDTLITDQEERKVSKCEGKKRERAVGKRYIDDIPNEDGFRQVPKICRKTIHRYNQHAHAKKMELEPFRNIIKKVDMAFDFACSHMHWFICYTWFTKNIPDWVLHRSIIAGEAAWPCDKLMERSTRSTIKALSAGVYEEGEPHGATTTTTTGTAISTGGKVDEAKD